MENKVCNKCKIEKPTKEFYQNKRGKNKGCYHSWCKECKREYRHKYARIYPWKRTYTQILNRCSYDKSHSYHRKGIKCYITSAELRKLWFRDKAYLMEKPSIDRLDRWRDYIFDNCRYIELRENQKRKRPKLNPESDRGKRIKKINVNSKVKLVRIIRKIIKADILTDEQVTHLCGWLNFTDTAFRDKTSKGKLKDFLLSEKYWKSRLTP